VEKGINHNDMEERSQQVTKMRDISSLARSVIAWLGETTDDTVAYPFVPDRHPGRQWTYKGIIRLLQKPYWSRIWVIQEALLPQFLEIWLGEYRKNAEESSQTMLQEDVTFIPSDVSQRRTLAILDVSGINLLETQNSYRAYRDPQNQLFRRLWLWLRPQSFELWWLIDSFSTSGCSVTHDKVYALLGLVNQNGRPSHDFVPDYTTSTKQLFLQLHETNTQAGEPDMWKERDFLNVFRRVCWHWIVRKSQDLVFKWHQVTLLRQRRIDCHRWNRETLHGYLFITAENKPVAPFRLPHANVTRWGRTPKCDLAVMSTNLHGLHEVI
jgi:hypothetical protein